MAYQTDAVSKLFLHFVEITRFQKHIDGLLTERK